MKRRARWLCLVAAVAGTILVAGCGGINASHSVSPATFLLPGLMKVEPPQPAPTDPAAVKGREVAVGAGVGAAVARSAADAAGQP